MHRLPTAMDRALCTRCCKLRVASMAAEVISICGQISGCYLCSLASSETSWPALETSLPAPSTVLQAVRIVDAPPRMTNTIKATANLLLINNSFDDGMYRQAKQRRCVAFGSRRTRRGYRRGGLVRSALRRALSGRARVIVDPANSSELCAPLFSLFLRSKRQRPDFASLFGRAVEQCRLRGVHAIAAAELAKGTFDIGFHFKRNLA